ncbi:MAG: sulfur oxidation c-type cytochrome SoxX [Halarcobacter sp.]
MKLIKSLVIAAAISGLAVTGLLANDDLIKKGEKIFMNKNLGNCLACHAANGKDIDGPGSMGPKLQYLSAWPEEALYEKIYNPYTTNPISQMPAFGKNGWLSDSEIKAVVAYLKTIN